mmetsp:Transcript_12177/g.19232  ORF Transcript_12177/g.19232 Transcript_12177/m.19232 type:complete len:203 (+) Transcript_12177:851-1459(+)
MNSLNALQSSVLPTPVGPKKMRDAIGLDGSFRPARERWIASVTTSTASSCPITRCLKLSPMFKIRSLSVSSSLLGGMPVQTATTFAISSAVTSSFNMRSTPGSFPSSLKASSCSNSFSNDGNVEYFNSAALFKSNSRSLFSISKVTDEISFFKVLRRSTPPFSANHLMFNSCCWRRRSSNSASIPVRRTPSSLPRLVPSLPS